MLLLHLVLQPCAVQQNVFYAAPHSTAQRIKLLHSTLHTQLHTCSLLVKYSLKLSFCITDLPNTHTPHHQLLHIQTYLQLVGEVELIVGAHTQLCCCQGIFCSLILRTRTCREAAAATHVGVTFCGPGSSSRWLDSDKGVLQQCNMRQQAHMLHHACWRSARCPMQQCISSVSNTAAASC